MAIAISNYDKQTIMNMSIDQFIDELSTEYDLSPAAVDTTLRCFCPIHKDRAFRTLIVDIERQLFKCSYTKCAAFKGGKLIELFMLFTGCSYEVAVDYWDKKTRGISIHISDIRNNSGNLINSKRQSDFTIVSTNSDESKLLPDKNLVDELDNYSQFTTYDKFMGQLDREIKRSARYDYPVSLLLMDVKGSPDSSKGKDNLKENDWRDEILSVLSRVVRASDTVSYYGVNKIAVMLPQIAGEQAGNVARRLQKSIRETIMKHRVSGAVTPWVHFGIASVDSNENDDPINAELLMSKAIDQLWDYSTQSNDENRKSDSE